MFKNLFDQKRMKQVSKHYDGLITLMRPLSSQEIAEILSEARITMDKRERRCIYQETFGAEDGIQLLKILKELTDDELYRWLAKIQRIAVESRFRNPRKITDSGMRLQ